jgi:hypothetical protein
VTESTRPARPAAEETDIEPTAPGTRSDQAGEGASVVGPAPGGGQADPSAQEATRSDPEIPTGDATGASGGYGTGSSDRSSSGTGEGQTDSGNDPETDWLREAAGGPDTGR